MGPWFQSSSLWSHGGGIDCIAVFLSTYTQAESCLHVKADSLRVSIFLEGKMHSGATDLKSYGKVCVCGHFLLVQARCTPSQCIKHFLWSSPCLFDAKRLQGSLKKWCWDHHLLERWWGLVQENGLGHYLVHKHSSLRKQNAFSTPKARYVSLHLPTSLMKKPTSIFI